MMAKGFGTLLREEISQGILPMIGIYDTFSAALAGKHFNGLFLSGFSFAASFYGLPDIGFITWTDMAAFVQRVRTILPHHHLLVDIDDGYCDPEVACHVVSLLEASQASGIVIEDQQRPRRCGHFEGKLLMELKEFILKLKKVIATRKDLFVIARTDASDFDEIKRRVIAFAEAGADAILVEAIKDLKIISELKRQVDLPFVYNQIAGGKSPSYSLNHLSTEGISIVNYSTPCLFAAQVAIENEMKSLIEKNGLLVEKEGFAGVKDCTAILYENLARRDSK